MNIATPNPPPIVLTLQPQAATTPLSYEGRHLELRPYEVVQATVVKGGLDKVELELGRHRFQALSKVPLQTGESLNLQVVATSPQIQFQIVNKPLIQHLMRTLHLLAEKFDLSSLFSEATNDYNFHRLGQNYGFWNKIASAYQFLNKSGENLSGQDLASIMRSLGLDMEALLAEGNTEKAASSLKAVLLSLLQEHQDQKQLAEKIKQLVFHIDMFQLCKIKLADSGMGFIPIPFSFLKQGFIVYQSEQRGDEADSDSNDSFSLFIYLQLESLGNLNIKLFYENHNLYTRFLCDSQQVADYISSCLDDLSKNLSACNLNKVTISTGAQEPATCLMNLMVNEGERLVNAKA